MVKASKDIIVNGYHDKPILLDIFYKADEQKPVIIYAHGFNGFKDWGNFDLIAKEFVEAGFTFIKFNFSHNGTTPEQPQEFADLDAYSRNNYSIELSDLKLVIDWTANAVNPFHHHIQTDKIFLLGHSMGGGIILVKAADDTRIQGVATWASVGACKTPWGNWPAGKMDEWKKEGVAYITNSRTKQNLPLQYQLFEDYQQNAERLNVEKAVEKLQIPLLLCHGTEDEAVPVSTAFTLSALNQNAEVFTLKSDHVFGRKHPWLHDYIPPATAQIVEKTIGFFKRICSDTP